MKKHSNIYPLIFGLIFVLVGILTYFTNGTVTVGFIIFGLVFIGISVSLFISDKKKKVTVAQNQPTVTPYEIKPQNNKQNIKKMFLLLQTLLT